MLNQIQKINGIQYTPSALSDFMAMKLYQYSKKYFSFDKTMKILDPACGDGKLLKAVESYFSNYHGIGIDIDKKAIKTAKLNLNLVSNQLYCGNYLDIFKDNTSTITQNVDLIIANPPYVRTKVLGASKSQEYAKRFELKGKINLYQVFLKAMTDNLHDGGLICVITSNKYLTTKSGKDIRRLLNDNYKILEIIDLGDTKPFDAAVLPAIFIGIKQKQAINKEIPFIKVYETKNINTNISKIEKMTDILIQEPGTYQLENRYLELNKGTLDASGNPKEVWNMATVEENNWAKKLEAKASYTFDDIFDVHVGIKTTADNVFIKKDWNQINFNMRPESQLLHKLISSKTITKWIPSNKLYSKILYTHTMQNRKRTLIDFNRYPRAWKYLLANYDQLASRSYIQKAKRQWFEIWVPQQPDKMSNNKIIFPDISEHAKFMYDNQGFYVDGNCYWITLKDNINSDYLLLATAVANSKVMAKYHDIKFQNKLYSGRKRYLTQYVKNYLLPDINNPHSQKILFIMRRIINNQSYTKNYEDVINNEVIKAFGVII